MTALYRNTECVFSSLFSLPWMAWDQFLKSVFEFWHFNTSLDKSCGFCVFLPQKSAFFPIGGSYSLFFYIYSLEETIMAAEHETSCLTLSMKWCTFSDLQVKISILQICLWRRKKTGNSRFTKTKKKMRWLVVLFIYTGDNPQMHASSYYRDY